MFMCLSPWIPIMRYMNAPHIYSQVSSDRLHPVNGMKNDHFWQSPCHHLCSWMLHVIFHLYNINKSSIWGSFINPHQCYINYHKTTHTMPLDGSPRSLRVARLSSFAAWRAYSMMSWGTRGVGRNGDEMWNSWDNLQDNSQTWLWSTIPFSKLTVCHRKITQKRFILLIGKLYIYGLFSLYQIIRGYVTIKNGGWSELVCWWSIGFLFICPTQKEIPLKIIFMSEVPVEHGNSSLAFSLRGVCLKIEDLYCHQRRKVLFYSLFFLGGFPLHFRIFSENHPIHPSIFWWFSHGFPYIFR